MRIISVELDKVPFHQRTYPIMIERGLLNGVGEKMGEMGLGGKCAVVTNPTVGKLYSGRVEDSLKKNGFTPILIELPDGEEYKTLGEVSKIYDRLVEKGFERGSPVLALGGGVVGDMAGFAAATFLRGVPYVHVPTTLLSQVDSSVGGKTGVNHRLGKNLIGAFYQPEAVFIDPDVLKTLDSREIRAGFSEVVKYGVIWDEGFFGFLEKNAAGLLSLGDEIITAIERSCRIKAEVVSKDERERGLRTILNFGHTIGHAIEACSEFKEFRHGEAISIGMVMEGWISLKLGLTAKDTVERIRGLLLKFGLPVEMPKVSPRELLQTIRLDKKVKHGNLRLVLVEGIGSVLIREVSDSLIEDFLCGKTNVGAL